MPQRKQKMMKWKHKWKRRKQQQQEQRVKMLKREQKKSKEKAKESQRATVWWRTQKTTPFIAVETAEVTGEEHPDRSTMNDDAGNEETSNETGERHRGRSVLRAANEDEDFIAIHNDLVGHDQDDGMEESKKIMRNQVEAKAHPQKPRRL